MDYVYMSESICSIDRWTVALLLGIFVFVYLYEKNRD